MPKFTVDITPTQFRPHLLRAYSVPGAILGVGKTEVGAQGKVPALELLLSLGDGNISNTEPWDESHDKDLYKGQRKLGRAVLPREVRDGHRQKVTLEPGLERKHLENEQN